MTKPGSSRPTAPATACADCGHEFADRSETRWDVHLPDGDYIVVCSACFQKRDDARTTSDDDEGPIEGSTAVLRMNKKSKPKKK